MPTVTRLIHLNGPPGIGKSTNPGPARRPPWRDGTQPTLEDACQALAYSSIHDAFEPA